MNIRDLKPANGQKSFYGKAQVVENNGTETLFSYGTPVVRREQNGEYTRLWDGWSATTGKHIASFAYGMNKREFLNLKMGE